jgi:hypothetical protein
MRALILFFVFFISAPLFSKIPLRLIALIYYLSQFIIKFTNQNSKEFLLLALIELVDLTMILQNAHLKLFY